MVYIEILSGFRTIKTFLCVGFSENIAFELIKIKKTKNKTELCVFILIAVNIILLSVFYDAIALYYREIYVLISIHSYLHDLYNFYL